MLFELFLYFTNILWFACLKGERNHHHWPPAKPTPFFLKRKIYLHQQPPSVMLCLKTTKFCFFFPPHIWLSGFPSLLDLNCNLTLLGYMLYFLTLPRTSREQSSAWSASAQPFPGILFPCPLVLLLPGSQGAFQPFDSLGSVNHPLSTLASILSSEIQDEQFGNDSLQ